MFKFNKIISLIQNNKSLTIIILIAATLRFGGVYPGYNPYHADEPAIYASAFKMVQNSTYDPGRYDYPATTMIINAISYKVFFIPLNWVKYYLTQFPGLITGIIKIPLSKEEMNQVFNTYIAGDRGVNSLFWGRYVTAIFAIGNIFLVFLLGKNIFGKPVGLISAFLLTFNFKQVVNSHLVLPDIYNSFFLLLSILVTLRLFRQQSLRNYILAGLAAGFSFSVKYQIYAILPLVLTHFFTSIPNKKLFQILNYDPGDLIEFVSSFFKKLLRPGIFVSLLLVPIVFIILNPFYLMHFEQARAQNLLDVKRYAFGTNQLNLYPLWYMYHFDYGPMQLFLFVLGSFLALVHSLKKTLILLAPISVFFYIFFYYSTGGFFVRNIVTTTPLFLIFTAFAIWFMYERMTKLLPKVIAKICLIIFLICAVFIPAENSLISSYNYTKPWNYVIMSNWLKANLPKDAIVAADAWDLIPYGPPMKRTDFAVHNSYSLAEHRENGATWALISSHWSPGHFYNWMNFGLEHLKDYWNKPMILLRNTYYGIATEEFFRYQAFAATKPWQASDANMIIAKLAVWPDVKMIKIKEFTFNENTDGWKVVAKDLENSPDYTYDVDTGHNKLGSIRYIPGSAPYSSARSSSFPIKIRPGYLYRVSGFIKLDKQLSNLEREGFIRVDFYGSDPKPAERGIITSVSARVFGTTDWMEKTILERAPDNAKYMVISFGNSKHAQSIMWLDDVQIDESVAPVEDITNKPPYHKRPIDLNPFYPNSHGNL